MEFLLTDLTCQLYLCRIVLGIFALYYSIKLLFIEKDAPWIFGVLGLLVFSDMVLDGVHIYSRVISESDVFEGVQYRNKVLWSMRLIPGIGVLGLIVFHMRQVVKARSK